MKKRIDTTQGLASLRKERRLNAACVVILLLLMVAFLGLTLYSSIRLSEQTDIISEHPFEVVIAAGNLKLHISEMSIRSGRLLLHREAEDIEIVRNAFDELSSAMVPPLAKLRELYLGDADDILAIVNTLVLIQEAQDEYLSIASSPAATDNEIEQYEQNQLSSLYDKALAETDRVISVAQERKVGYGKTADTLRSTTSLLAVILMIVMAVVLVLSQMLLRRQRRELVFRNQLFDNLSQNIDDTFLIRDAKTGAIHYRALNMKRVLGLSSQNLKNGYQGIAPEDAKSIHDAVGEPGFAFPYIKTVEYTKPTGEKRWISIRVYRTDEMDAPQLISVFSDVTEEILSRQALQDAIANAEQANTAKSQFLSRMSHEIRTPLNAIIGMTTIAAASVREPLKVEDCLSKINFSSKHLLMLINDILDMSKIESNKMVLQSEPFDIFEIVNGFVSTVYAQAKSKGLDFQESMTDFGEHTVFVGDALRLNQILLNLSSNALKFTSPGGRIRLDVSRIASKSTVDVLRFVVSDTGIGMSAEVVDKIFQPFEQADASISSRYGGTGLGMTITKNLVMLMNGKMRIESTPGVGTSCIVELPFQRGPEDISEPDFRGQGLRALIVDDERSVCEQVGKLLDKIKIYSEWSVSGCRAVEMVRKSHLENKDYDLCLIDWKMPDMDGVDVARHIHQDVDADIPIVLISAYDITEIEQEARSVGVKGFLPKPLYRSSVYTVIKDLLEDSIGGREKVPEPDAGCLPLAGMKLLMAEDNDLNREIAEELLRMNGAEVHSVNDGKEALDAFLSSGPGDYDAILLDVQMPVMDGLEAARRIRISEHPVANLIPIIATTANAFSSDISAVLASGMNAHVSKPLDIQQLCRVLAGCVKDFRQR